jgi:uncharacterized damage-inducible protein DinB
MNSPDTVAGERADLLDSLARHRWFLRYTVRDVTDEQAAERTTVSALSLGGLIKHVAATELAWADFIVDGPAAISGADPEAMRKWADDFRLLAGETLASVLADYERVAADTDRLISTLPDLDQARPLPQAPWFKKGATWSARRVILHIIAETAQHAGHADILRESLDGSKTMG